jgi:hypothetical protein
MNICYTVNSGHLGRYVISITLVAFRRLRPAPNASSRSGAGGGQHLDPLVAGALILPIASARRPSRALAIRIQRQFPATPVIALTSRVAWSDDGTAMTRRCCTGGIINSADLRSCGIDFVECRRDQSDGCATKAGAASASGPDAPPRDQNVAGRWPRRRRRLENDQHFAGTSDGVSRLCLKAR